MNELLLYAIVKAILSKSKVMQGRFIVAEGYGNDLNANNFEDMVKDALDNYVNPSPKYPISVMMPPVEVIEDYAGGKSRFKIDQFFLCTTGFTGRNEIKNRNIKTNTSDHPIIWDWKDMREVAGDFRKVFNLVLRRDSYLNVINSATDARDYIRRVSNMGNDKLSGVQVTYELNIAMPCELADYEDTDDIILPPLNTIIHTLHEH